MSRLDEIRELLDKGDRLDTTFQWLIERGQPENQVPTVWLSSLPTCDRNWTMDANEAAMFPTREDAEKWIYEHLTHPIHGASARAVEHGFMRVSRYHSKLRDAAVNALPDLLAVVEAAEEVMKRFGGPEWTEKDWQTRVGFPVYNLRAALARLTEEKT